MVTEGRRRPPRSRLRDGGEPPAITAPRHRDAITQDRDGTGRVLVSETHARPRHILTSSQAPLLFPNPRGKIFKKSRQRATRRKFRRGGQFPRAVIASR